MENNSGEPDQNPRNLANSTGSDGDLKQTITELMKIVSVQQSQIADLLTQKQEREKQQKKIGYKIPCRASWAFGNKLITYEQSLVQIQNSPQQFWNHKILISQVTYDRHFLNRAEKLENAIVNKNLVEYCHYKLSDNKLNQDLHVAWRLISLMFENEKNIQIENIIKLFGYETNLSNDNLTDHIGRISQSTSNSTDLSSSHQTNQTNQTDQTDLLLTSFEQTCEHRDMSKLLFSHNFNIKTNDTCLGSIINKTILTRNTSEAIENCINNGCWSEALLICCFIDTDYIPYTVNKYFDHCFENKRNDLSSLLWIKIIMKIAPDDLEYIFQQIINNIDLKYWREILSFILLELNDTKHSTLVKSSFDKLSNRLVDKYNEDKCNDDNNNDDKAKDWLLAALYCYILNRDYTSLVKFNQIIDDLDLLEMLLIIHKANSSDEYIEPNELTEQYAGLLVQEGKLDLALRYLNRSHNQLKQRIIDCLTRPTPYFTPKTINRQRMGSIVQNNYPLYQNQQPYISNAPSYVPNQTKYQQPSYMSNSSSNIYDHNLNYPMSRSVPPSEFNSPAAIIQPSAVNYHSTAPKSIPNQAPAYSDNIAQQSVPAGWNDPPIVSAAATVSGTGHRKLRTYSGASYDQPNPQPIAQPTVQPMMQPMVQPMVQRPVLQQMVQPMVQPVVQPVMQQVIQPTVQPTVQPVAQIYTPPPIDEQIVHQRVQTAKSFERKPSLPTLSAENQQLYNSFENLFILLQQVFQSQPLNMRRKLDDVKNRLEILKSKLALEQLSKAALEGLNSIALSINQNDFHSALLHYNNLVASTTFGEIVTFLPAIKVMINMAQQNRI